MHPAKRLPSQKPKKEPPERQILKNKQCGKFVLPQASNLQPFKLVIQNENLEQNSEKLKNETFLKLKKNEKNSVKNDSWNQIDEHYTGSNNNNRSVTLW